MRTWLVEDDEVLADALARTLAQAAHAVDIVSSGDEADRAGAENWRPDGAGHRPAGSDRPGGAAPPARDLGCDPVIFGDEEPGLAERVIGSVAQQLRRLLHEQGVPQVPGS